ncbi:MAG: AraC family transcriptional regulator [Prevotella sp.]|nr:helix-turn-helix domain-containing protein [Prevotella sp.]MBD9299645.1 AraC family transcriptional regulator [Prevotella sp.]
MHHSEKEIAAETGFDNLSFFGKYVKRELGMSPRDYRQKS